MGKNSARQQKFSAPLTFGDVTALSLAVDCFARIPSDSTPPAFSQQIRELHRI